MKRQLYVDNPGGVQSHEILPEQVKPSHLSHKEAVWDFSTAADVKASSAPKGPESVVTKQYVDKKLRQLAFLILAVETILVASVSAWIIHSCQLS